jgi:hypothetical protein
VCVCHINTQTHTLEHTHKNTCIHTHTHTRTSRHAQSFTNSRTQGNHSQTAPCGIAQSVLYMELPAKLLDYFLRSNKSNINQCDAQYQNVIIQILGPQKVPDGTTPFRWIAFNKETWYLYSTCGVISHLRWNKLQPLQQLQHATTQPTNTQYNTLQHTTTRYNTLQRQPTATHCNTLQHATLLREEPR